MTLGWSSAGRRWGLIGLLALALGLLAGCQPTKLPGSVAAQNCISQRSGTFGASGGLVVALRANDPTSADHTSALYGVRASDGAVAWSCASSTYAGWDDAQLVNGVIYALAGTAPTKDAPAPTHAHGLYAIRPHDGQQLWSYSFQAGSTSALAFDGGLAFFTAVTADGSAIHSDLYAIHTSNGALVWSESFGHFAGQPIVVDHRLIVPILATDTQGSQPTQELRAISMLDGSTLWSITLSGGDELASWLSLGDTLYYTDGAALTALDATTGKTRWTQPGVSNMNSPLFSAAGAILFSASQSVFAFDQASGAMRWSAVLNNRPQLLTASSSLAYAATQDSIGVANRLYALDIQTGDVRWQHDAPFAASVTPDASGATYFTISTGPQKLASVVALDPRGALRWTYKGQSPYAGLALIPTGDVIYYVWQDFQTGITVNAPVNTYVTYLRASDGVVLWTTLLAARNAMPLPPLLIAG
jgi:outer membrane protein assembly factor BamB